MLRTPGLRIQFTDRCSFGLSKESSSVHRSVMCKISQKVQPISCHWKSRLLRNFSKLFGSDITGGQQIGHCFWDFLSLSCQCFSEQVCGIAYCFAERCTYCPHQCTCRKVQQISQFLLVVILVLERCVVIGLLYYLENVQINVTGKKNFLGWGNIKIVCCNLAADKCQQLLHHVTVHS